MRTLLLTNVMLTLIGLFSIHQAHAADPDDASSWWDWQWQLGSAVEYTSITVDSAEFNPWLAKLMVTADVAYGLGWALHYGVGVKGETVDQVALEMVDYSAFYLTYTDYVVSDLLLRILIGRSEMELDSNLEGTGFPGKQHFRGESYGIVLEEKLERWPNWVAMASFHQVFKDDIMRVNSVSVGAYYAF